MHTRNFPTQIASAFTLEGKNVKGTVGQPRRTISSKPPVEWNPGIPEPVADTKFDKVVHWSEVDGNCSRCRKFYMTYTLKCSMCEVG